MLDINGVVARGEANVAFSDFRLAGAVALNDDLVADGERAPFLRVHDESVGARCGHVEEALVGDRVAREYGKGIEVEFGSDTLARGDAECVSTWQFEERTAPVGERDTRHRVGERCASLWLSKGTVVRTVEACCHPVAEADRRVVVALAVHHARTVCAGERAVGVVDAAVLHLVEKEDWLSVYEPQARGLTTGLQLAPFNGNGSWFYVHERRAVDRDAA